MENFKGKEGSLTFEIITDKFNPIIIKVYDESNLKINETIEHQLLFPNAIFGYDVSDVNAVNEKLDELLNKLL